MPTIFGIKSFKHLMVCYFIFSGFMVRSFVFPGFMGILFRKFSGFMGSTVRSSMVQPRTMKLK